MDIDIPNDDVKICKLHVFKADGRYSRENLPLLNIPPDHIVPDKLHLFITGY